MKKRILCRALIGAPIGLAISTAITIFSSLIYGDGNYYPVVPALVEQCGTFPVAYLMYWMKHSIAGVVVYFAIFIGIYVGIWITLYSRAKREVTKLNEKVSLQNR